MSGDTTQHQMGHLEERSVNPDVTHFVSTRREMLLPADQKTGQHLAPVIYRTVNVFASFIMRFSTPVRFLIILLYPTVPLQMSLEAFQRELPNISNCQAM
jgi:hypothetical protein